MGTLDRITDRIGNDDIGLIVRKKPCLSKFRASERFEVGTCIYSMIHLHSLDEAQPVLNVYRYGGSNRGAECFTLVNLKRLFPSTYSNNLADLMWNIYLGP